MGSLALLYFLVLIVITVFAAVMFKRRGHLLVAAKGAFGSFLALIIACFVYGLFNRFSFWHGASPAGIESGIGYAIIFGVSVGPMVFVIGGLAAAAISHASARSKVQEADRPL